ncbi:hypothetical protein [Marinobacter oulmenensis]|uniref:Uncharacterized protein n=1 Tax=Marinobacter oulmenensis TaxID=643747 RepID=A0A840U643_9GAMM|nr:hypothetical protein [Marinobacter oulmenensis]MBB5321194.1 hypothetical protein [Marinobacter oulmenensis]
MTIEHITNRQAFEEVLREDQLAMDEAERQQAIEARKRREREHRLDLDEEARNSFGGPA